MPDIDMRMAELEERVASLEQAIENAAVVIEQQQNAITQLLQSTTDSLQGSVKLLAETSALSWALGYTILSLEHLTVLPRGHLERLQESARASLTVEQMEQASRVIEIWSTLGKMRNST